MEQVEILRKFIQRVQAMKSPDHNGEDNFARDFMVSPSPRCCLLSPASKPTASSPARPGRQRFVCGCKERGGGGARQPQGPGWTQRLGGEIAPRPPFLSSCDRGPFRPRPGREERGRWPSPHLAPPPATTYCFSGWEREANEVQAGRLFSSPQPVCSSWEGRGRKESG